MSTAPVLLRVLRDPARLRDLSLADWDLLLRQARAAHLLARIALLAQRHAPDAIAPQAMPHFEGALLVAQRHREAVEWEITQLGQALDSAGLPLILLKGAAYLAASAPAAIGRSFADAPEIDGCVYLNGERDVKPGDLVNVLIEHSDEYDLWGTKVS